MAKTKLELGKLTVTGKIELARQIVLKMTGNASFTTPAPAPAALTTAATAAETAFNDAEGARITAKQKTVVQNTNEDALAALLTGLAAYVDNASAGKTEPRPSGSGLVAISPAPCPPTPHLPVRAARKSGADALVGQWPAGHPELPTRAPAPLARTIGSPATAGDNEATIDLTWDPAGTIAYSPRLAGGNAPHPGKPPTPAPDLCHQDPNFTSTGPWTLSRTVTKSSATVDGLTSGQRAWFRVAAVGAAGQGPWSDPATKIVP